MPFIKSVQGLQIVNGAQTTASIHRAKKIDGVDVSTVSVAAKSHVRSGTDQEFVSKISLYANSQNVIQLADLSANNEFHVEIERLSETNWCPGEQERWFMSELVALIKWPNLTGQPNLQIQVQGRMSSS